MAGTVPVLVLVLQLFLAPGTSVMAPMGGHRSERPHEGEIGIDGGSLVVLPDKRCFAKSDAWMTATLSLRPLRLAQGRRHANMRLCYGVDWAGIMTLRLWIENVDRLPDGGPLRVEVKGRGLDLGRDTHLDWTLPDPGRSISSKHCEIRFRDGGYWLHDVSTNGTYVNGGQYRLDAPYLLRSGDRLSIGPYIIAVEIEGRCDVVEFGAATLSTVGNDWGGVGEVAPPDDQKAPPSPPSDIADLDWGAFVPQPRRSVAERPHVGEPAANQLRPTEPEASPQTEVVDVLRRIARAAGISEQTMAGRDPETVADEIGLALRLTAQNLQVLLSSRAESKTLMRTPTRTMIHSTQNNPLKFTGAVEEALAILLGPPTRQYLDLRSTIEESFRDIKTHQLLTYGAMQGALDALFDDLAPDEIDRSVAQDRGLGSIVVPRKAKLWDMYVERWRAKTKRSDGRLFEAFIALFAEAYDRLQSKR